MVAGAVRAVEVVVVVVVVVVVLVVGVVVVVGVGAVAVCARFEKSEFRPYALCKLHYNYVTADDDTM